MLALALLATVLLQFQFDASEFTNAVYHVACLAGQVQCTNSRYTEFWNERHKVTRQDGAEFDAWKDVFRRAEKRAAAPDPMPLLPNFAQHYPSLRVRQDLIAAALESASPEDFEGRIRKLIPADDAARLRKVLTHVQERLRPWWHSHGRKLVESHLAELRRYMASADLTPLAQDAAKFLKARTPSGPVHIHLVPGPTPEHTNATAPFVRNHILVEVLPADKPRDTSWKVMHELTHAMYETKTGAEQASLMEHLIKESGREGQPLYAFLNEAIATGVQLLLFERYGLKDDDAYDHPFIPRLARAVAPLLKSSMARGSTLHDGFIPAYISASRAELGETIRSPRFLLSSTAVLGSGNKRDLFFAEFAPITAVTEETEWRWIRELNAVRLLTYDELGPYADQIPDLEALKQRTGFVSVKPHGRAGMQVFVAGRDVDALRATVKRLASTASLPVSGSVLPD